ncbi:MAG: hypothetical protein E7441_06055 [Ruminococcaceae bacterium]|nr:hypothetical protein [Oscillospiraceae bacterium]
MKKILSILIAISLIISMLPVAFADGETGREPEETTYKFISDDATVAGLISKTNTSPYTVSVETADGSTYYLNSTYMEYSTARKWKFFDVSDDLLKTSTDTDQNNNQQFRIHSGGYLQMNNKAATSLEFAFSLQAPEVAGFYIPAIKGYQGAKVTTNPYKVSITPDVYDAPFDKSVYEKEIQTKYTTPSWGEFTQTATNAVYTANTDKIVVALHTDNTKSHKLYSITLNPIINPVMTTTSDVGTTLSFDTIKESQTLALATKVTGKDSGGADVTMPVSNNFITYKSSKPEVATVADDGTITAVGNGTATIYAVTSDEKYSSIDSGITVNVTALDVVEPEDAPTSVNYGVFVSDVTCASAVTANGTKLSEATGNIVTGTLNPGATLTATAEDNVPGYKFRYWVLGSAATGRYYSSDNTVTVNPYANIALTAIYTAVEEETEYLDFFNWNGDYVDSKAIADGKVTELPTATLTGYEFAHWLLEDNVTEITSENYKTTAIPDGVSKAMAQYTALIGYDSSNKPTGTSANGWTRNGKLVTYSATYEFFKWLNEVGEIKAYDVKVEDQIPLVVLEESNGVYMIEYDEGEYDIVEAGILFGSDAAVDVESAYSKATVKRLLPHGQFTAAPIANATAGLQSSARGYVMYRDTEENIKVVYSN